MSTTHQSTVEIDLGGHLVTVPKGGLYDRYRMNPDVDEIARDPRVSGVAVRPARHGTLGFVDLLAGLGNDHLESYVLSLPVSSDIAQVRGHDGYGFPKWVTELDVDIDATRTTARVADDGGETDLSLSVATPTQSRYRSGDRVSTLTSYTSINGSWHSTLSQTNILSAGSALFPRDVDLRMGRGRLSEDLRSLAPFKNVRLDVTTEGQLALHMPVPTSVPSRK